MMNCTARVWWLFDCGAGFVDRDSFSGKPSRRIPSPLSCSPTKTQRDKEPFHAKRLRFPSYLQLTAYVLLAAPTPYPVFCIGFVLSGIGAGTVQCLATAFLMKLHRNQNLKQCLCQACYGESIQSMKAEEITERD
jgi:hypothetical protein